jgi:hypothetical protein
MIVTSWFRRVCRDLGRLQGQRWCRVIVDCGDASARWSDLGIGCLEMDAGTCRMPCPVVAGDVEGAGAAVTPRTVDQRWNSLVRSTPIVCPMAIKRIPERRRTTTAIKYRSA